jgi:23S rRNA G2445 N2-methylase RlmL
MHLAGHDRPTAQAEVAVNTDIGLDLVDLAERLIKKFDHEPELKARIAAAIFELDGEVEAEPLVDKS